LASEFERIKRKANQLRSTGRLQESSELYRKYLKVHPSDREALLNLGDVQMRQEKFQDAAGTYSALVERFPRDPTVHANLGASLLRLGRVSDARTVLDFALEIDPRNIFARINLGGVLQAQEDYQGALKNALEAVSVDPTNPLTFNNLGSAFSDLNMLAEAKHAYETSLMLDSRQIDATVNLAVVFSRMGDHASATKTYELALSFLPPEQNHRAEAIKFFACFGYFYMGDWEKAWDFYEFGFSPLIPLTGARSPKRKFHVPRWNGESAPGKTLMVWREQGVGDEILFASIFKDLERLGMTLIFECEPRLVSLWRRSFPQVKVREPKFDPNTLLSTASDYDFHLPICSLGSIFRRSRESFDGFAPYIKPDPLIRERFSTCLQELAGDRPKVGILWRSIKLTPNRNRAYTAPSQWEGVLGRQDLCFFSLQYNPDRQEILDAEERFKTKLNVFDDVNYKDDFESVAAIVSLLDLVISPDTTMFEIAGALNIPTICMTVHPEGHYGCRSQFPFYPSVFVLTTDRFEEDATDLLRKLPIAVDRFLPSPYN